MNVEDAVFFLKEEIEQAQYLWDIVFQIFEVTPGRDLAQLTEIQREIVKARQLPHSILITEEVTPIKRYQFTDVVTGLATAKPGVNWNLISEIATQPLKEEVNGYIYELLEEEMDPCVIESHVARVLEYWLNPDQGENISLQEFKKIAAIWVICYCSQHPREVCIEEPPF